MKAPADGGSDLTEEALFQVSFAVEFDKCVADCVLPELKAFAFGRRKPISARASSISPRAALRGSPIAWPGKRVTRPNAQTDLSKNLVAKGNHPAHFYIRNSNGSLKLQMGSGTDGTGVDHVPPVPLRAVSLPASSALRRCGEQETGLSTQLAGGFSGGARKPPALERREP